MSFCEVEQLTTLKTQQNVSTAAECGQRMVCHQKHNCSSRKSSRITTATSVWLWYALIICCSPISCLGQAEVEIPTTLWSQTTEPPVATTSATTYSPSIPVFNLGECRNSFDSREQEKYICLRHPDLFPILAYAEQLAKNTCEKDFEHELWNCSGFSLLKQPNVTKGDDVFKESAYTYALSMAAITHSVARGCAQNLIRNCSCSEDGSCPDNVEYGLGIAETLLNKRYTSQGSSLKQELAQHNFRAAKLIIRGVMNSTEKTCHCHGISGSCTFSICHSELPSFEQVASAVKKSYTQSCRVSSSGQSQNKWVSQCEREFTETDLIYRDNANWCQVNPYIGARGVIGRECSPHQDAPNSCKKLCNDQCGRGSTDYVEVREKQCGCKFAFCCEIHCETCTEERTYYRCT